MAVEAGYSKIATSGSVFIYDTGDTINSYAGEPTTNQYTNPAFTNGTTGWTFGSWDSGNFTYSVENVLGPFGQIIPALKITRTGTSTYAHFHQNNSGKYTTGNQYTLSAYVIGAGTLRGNSQWGDSVSLTLSSQWQRVNYTVTAPNNSLYPYWAAEAITQNVPMYFVFAQSEQKSHVTPYVNGTRSNTQGLLDISGGGNSLNLVDMSYDANAMMTFDGTNDTISIPSNSSNSVTGNITMELILNRTAGYSAAVMHKDVQYSIYVYNDGYITYADSSTWSYAAFGAHGNLTAGVYHHLVATKSGSLVTIYLDGNVVVSKNFGGAITNTFNNLYIGSYAGSSSYFGGYIPVSKIYNRGLSAAEVLSNFNHYKTRFNIT